jgi:geranylgeranyl diphosphate synthase type I
VENAIKIFEKYGSINYTHNIALENVQKAKELLVIVEDSPSKEALILLADFVLQRSH